MENSKSFLQIQTHHKLNRKRISLPILKILFLAYFMLKILLNSMKARKMQLT
jgi:hypothetical protein